MSLNTKLSPRMKVNEVIIYACLHFYYSEEVYAVTTPTAVNISTVTSVDIKVDGGSLVLVSLLEQLPYR